MKRMSIILLACIFLLSSCRHSKLPDQNPTIDSNLQTPAIDTSIYTSENPYVLENIRLTDEESLSSLPDYGRMAINISKLSRKIEWLLQKGECSIYVVRKKSSQSYYWEEGEKHVIYTDSVVEIKDKIFGNNDKYSNSNVGDELQLIEFFSKSPTGEIWSSFTDTRDNTVCFTLRSNRFPTTFDYDVHVLSTTINEVVYGTFDYVCEMAPLLKFDTDYLLVVEENYYYSEGDRFYIDYHEISESEFIGKYVKFFAYEFNEDMYNYATDDLQNYKDQNGETKYKQYISKNGIGHYNKMVADAWETYGERVAE